MVYNLEWWHLVIGISSTLIGIGLSIFGHGFKSWSNRLADMSERIDRRLLDIEDRIKHHDDRFHQLHVSVESRVSWIEAKINGRKPPESP